MDKDLHFFLAFHLRTISNYIALFSMRVRVCVLVTLFQRLNFFFFFLLFLRNIDVDDAVEMRLTVKR